MSAARHPARWLLVAAAVLASVFYLAAPGTIDLRLYWPTWTSKVVQLGPVEGYRAIHSAQPPLYSLVFYGLGTLSRLVGADPGMCLRISGLVSEWLMVLLFWRWRKDFPATMAACVSSILLVGLGYLDVYYGVFLVLTLVSLERKRLFLAGVVFAIAVLIKAQPYVVAPFFLAHLVFAASAEARRRGQSGAALARAALRPLFGFCLIAVPTVVIYFHGFVESLSFAAKGNYFNGCAFNSSYLVNYFANRFAPAGIGAPGLLDGAATLIRPTPALSIPFKILGVLVYLPIFALYLKRRSDRLLDLLVFSALGFLAYCMFSQGVHENHLFTPVLLLIIASSYDAALAPLAWFWALLLNLNVYMFFGASGQGEPFHRVVLGLDMALPFSLLGVAAFFLTARTFFRSLPRRP